MSAAKSEVGDQKSEVGDSPDRWLIWSNEHGGWWRPDGGGYTAVRKEAGRYSFADALRITTAANKYLTANMPNETMCPEWNR